eukprot:2866425-Rhodomonas_salina.1
MPNEGLTSVLELRGVFEGADLETSMYLVLPSGPSYLAGYLGHILKASLPSRVSSLILKRGSGVPTGTSRTWTTCHASGGRSFSRCTA